ncbi:hypothetical protein HDV57DRAFT_64404 [Trichoderma longibrachiatum]
MIECSEAGECDRERVIWELLFLYLLTSSAGWTGQLLASRDSFGTGACFFCPRCQLEMMRQLVRLLFWRDLIEAQMRRGLVDSLRDGCKVRQNYWPRSGGEGVNQGGKPAEGGKKEKKGRGRYGEASRWRKGRGKRGDGRWVVRVWERKDKRRMGGGGKGKPGKEKKSLRVTRMIGAKTVVARQLSLRWKGADLGLPAGRVQRHRDLPVQ